jgi:hypothetical protein
MHLVDNASAPDKVQQARKQGDPFTLVVTGAHSPRLVGHILVEAMREGLELDRVAVMSWNSGSAMKYATRVLVAKAMHYPPDLSLEDMIPGSDPELIGSVWQVINARAYYGGSDPVTGEHRRLVADQFAELVKRMNDMGAAAADRKFLRHVRRQVDAVIRLSVAARCDETPLLEAYRLAIAAGERLPAFSFVVEVADYFEEFKRVVKVADLADQLAAGVEPVTACELALLEDAGAVPPLGLRALRRLLPNASFVLAGVDSEAATQHAERIFG